MPTTIASPTKIQAPAPPTFSSIAALAKAAMEAEDYQAAQAADRMMAWLAASPALATQFAEDLQRRGALQACLYCVKTARDMATGRASWSAKDDDEIPPSPLRMVPAALPALRPVGVQRQGYAATVASEDRYMNFRLSDGLELRRAAREAIRQHAFASDAMIATMVLRRTWLLLVAEALPNETQVVEDVLTEGQLAQMYEQAKERPNA